jgi:hypothetical protein
LGSLTREAALREAFGPQFKREEKKSDYETAKEFIKRLEAEQGILTDLPEQPGEDPEFLFEDQPDFTPMFPESDFAMAFELEVQEAYKGEELFRSKVGNKTAETVISGGSNAYYQLPEGAKELGDLIEFKDMNFNVGNIFKAAYRLGEKAGNTRIYDLEKIIWFAKRELERERKKVALL